VKPSTVKPDNDVENATVFRFAGGIEDGVQELDASAIMMAWHVPFLLLVGGFCCGFQALSLPTTIAPGSCA
jgi:hypothetical protein